MALAFKVEALVRKLNGALFTKTREAGKVGGHSPIERGESTLGPGQAVSASS